MSTTRITDHLPLIFYMHIFRKLEDVPSDFGPTLVGVGNFDGVHGDS